MNVALCVVSAKKFFSQALVITRARTDNWSQKNGQKKGAEPKPCPIKNNLDYFFNATLKAMIALFNFLTSSCVTVFLARAFFALNFIDSIGPFSV